jgi:hypothetical protein
MQNRFRKSLSSLFFSFGLMGVGSQLAATEIINETFRSGEEPADWSSVDVNFPTAAGGRADIAGTTGVLTSPVFDASDFDNLSIVFQVAKFSSGDNGPITVEYSINGGTNWVTLGNSPIPANADYLAADFVIPTTSATMRLRFTAENSPSAKRFRDLVVTGAAGSVPPEWGMPVISGITPDSAGASVPFIVNQGTGFIEHGVVISLTNTNAEPALEDSDVAIIDFSGQPPETFEVVLTDLEPSTNYSLRAFVQYDGGTVYSDTVTFLTLPAHPLLSEIEPYLEDFADFVDSDTLPAGWSFDLQGSSGDYVGDWGDGFNSGFRGNASVLGYQITTGSNSLVKILTLVNNTGETITDLTVQYTGRVERATESRNAEYTVTVDGVAVPALTYSTAAGVDQTLSAIVSGLDIVDGESFTIEWQATQLAGGGSTRQIGISNVNVSVGANELPPSIGFFALFEGSLTDTGFGVDAEVASDGGSAITQAGFVLSETALEPNPTLDTPNTLIVIDDFFDGVFFFADFEDLNPGTSYSVRAFASNSVGTTYTAPLVITTIAPPLSLLAGTEYTESFSNFTGILPDGWSISGPITTYNGDWGIGSGAGLRGGEENPGVLGYQHTGSTGVFTVTLELVNDTGDTITDLFIAYTGRVERASEGRSPIWTVSVDGVEVPELSYSTAGGVDEDIEFVLSGLNIANGDTFTISWSSERGAGGGSSKQIGISNVSIESLVITVPTPIFTLESGTFFSDQIVYISNFANYDSNVALFYTTDGSNPDASSSLYNDEIGILLEDGLGPVTLRVVGIDSVNNEESFITSTIYNFPLNLANLTELRAQEPTANAFYRVTNTMILSGQDSFRNTKFFQDASGAGIQIDDNDGIIETEYASGDAVGSLLGTLTVFQGQLQLVPALDPGEPISSGNSLTPVLRTLASLSSSDQSILVRINEIEFESGDGVSTFAGGGTQTAITDSSIAGFTGIYRNFFGDSNITGALIPEGVGSVIGIIQERNDGLTIGARGVDDLDFLPPPFIPDDFDDFVAVAPEGQRGIADAPAGDGVANLFKYAFGGSPIIADRSMLPSDGIVEDSGQNYFSLTFTPERNFTWDAAAGTFSDGVVLLTVEISTDLADWNPATGMVLVGGGTQLVSGQTVTLRMDTPVAQNPRIFLRISGERIEAIQ